jgi:hypothetical protein
MLMTGMTGFRAGIAAFGRFDSSVALLGGGIR